MFSADHAEHGHIADINRGKSFVWDNDSLQSIEIRRNLFCAGHCTLGDGRLLVVGGQNTFQDVLSPGRTIFGGGADKDVHTFDPVGEEWEQHGNMEDARWYPTCTTLSDGRGFIIGGADEGYWSSCGFSEVFDTTNDDRTSRTEVYDDPAYPEVVYPFVHLLPGGLLTCSSS